MERLAAPNLGQQIDFLQSQLDVYSQLPDETLQEIICIRRHSLLLRCLFEHALKTVDQTLDMAHKNVHQDEETLVSLSCLLQQTTRLSELNAQFGAISDNKFFHRNRN